VSLIMCSSGMRPHWPSKHHLMICFWSRNLPNIRTWHYQRLHQLLSAGTFDTSVKCWSACPCLMTELGWMWRQRW
jgi:hypothetical protein